MNNYFSSSILQAVAYDCSHCHGARRPFVFIQHVVRLSHGINQFKAYSQMTSHCMIISSMDNSWDCGRTNGYKKPTSSLKVPILSKNRPTDLKTRATVKKHLFTKQHKNFCTFHLCHRLLLYKMRERKVKQIAFNKI